MYTNSGDLVKPAWRDYLPVSTGCVDGDSMVDLLTYLHLDRGPKFVVTADGTLVTDRVVVTSVIVSQLDK